MSKFEIYSLIISGIIAFSATVIGVFQIKINHRLKKINDYVSISIVPDLSNNRIKLLNTGKINLYIYGFETDGNIKKYERGRLLTANTLDSSFYYFKLNENPREGEFVLKIYLEDEFGKKYITEGGGENIDGRISIWTYHTKKFKWNFPNNS